MSRNALAEGEYLLFEASPEFDIRAINHSTDISLIKQDLTLRNGYSNLGNSLSPDGTLFVYSLSLDEGLILLNLTDHSISHVMGGQGCIYPSFAPDGQHVAVICQGSNIDPGIFIIDLAKETRSQQLVTTTHDALHSLAWSPDGKWLAYL